MKVVAATLVALLATSVTASDDSATPLQKVLQLLSDLQAKITAEGKAAVATQEEYARFCRSRTKDLEYEVKTGTSEAADLTAEIEELASTIERLNAQIEEFSGRVAKNEADLKAAKEVRAGERADFEAEEKNSVKIIGALERAINILEREAAQGKFAGVQLQNAGSLMQALKVMVDTSMLRSEDAQQLQALVQSTHEEEDMNAPTAANYQSHSGGIIDVLGDLLDKAKSQLNDGREKEKTGAQNFKMLEQSLTDAINVNNRDLENAKASLTAAKGSKASAESELGVTKKTLQASSKGLADLKQECATKAADHEAEVKSRGEELKALAGAKKVIADMTSGAGTLSYSLTQCSRMSLGVESAHSELIQFVRKLAEHQHSQALTQLARRISSAIHQGNAAGEDPFTKVKGLIMDLIKRLESEAAADASHKAYCDDELAFTKYKEDKGTAHDKRLTTQIDKMTAHSATLKEEVAALQSGLAALAATQVEMDKLRKEEHQQFIENKHEMELGIEGIRVALKTLRTYYNAQHSDHDAAAGSSGGIIGMLEVIESDFAKGFAEMLSVEATAQSDYEKATQENEVEKTEKGQDVHYKTKTITELTATLATETSYREGIRTELSATLAYKAKLLEMCMPKAETYAERKAKRDTEIAGLKEALSILENEAALVQRETAVKRVHG